ncbi:PP2C family protein-serine/threonine phosphatase [Nocardioides coralli]|uniref:PP2C family protein-serine/threonine phosphatase n=1 Tax=Nocardioides coralli TaxID=2872154 RepID=UPI001CA3ADD6|nr:PP2C family serine/threonine-protein phosphatase [Nocardioides coralli]QZY28664.1 protein phosphatase 2C domain-containing protein [Nocardioides coralli]
MKQVELHHGARTDVGRVREVNEDAYLAAPPVFAVADGMGGHEGGDVASRVVVEELGRLADRALDPTEAREQLAAALATCQQRIAEIGADGETSRQARSYAGTTVVAAIVVDDGGPAWFLVNLGDSRAYRLSQGRLSQVSTDHSLVQELVDAGSLSTEDAATHPERNVITRALGGREASEPDYFLLPLAEAPRLLLCSDGINGMIDDAAIEEILGATDDPRDAADRLVEAALAAGGRDNATAVVVDVVGWADVPDYDADRQRSSLERKLGALP